MNHQAKFGVILGGCIVALLLVLICSIILRERQENEHKFPQVKIRMDSGDGIFVEIENNSFNFYHAIPYFSFDLEEGSEGYIRHYKSLPHGLFTGYELGPGIKRELMVNVEKRHGSFRYKDLGQEITLGKEDRVLLCVELKVADYDKGISFVVSNSFPVEGSLVDGYLDSETIKNQKSEMEDVDDDLIERLSPLE